MLFNGNSMLFNGNSQQGRLLFVRLFCSPIFLIFSIIHVIHWELHIFSRVLRDSTTRFVGPSVRRSVRPSVRPSVRHTLGFCGIWPHCSCPNDLVTSNTAPAHPHATGVAVYPALFFQTRPSRPIGATCGSSNECVTRPTNRPTNQSTNRRTQPVIEVLCCT